MTEEERGRERVRIREENKKILKEELSGKEVVIKTNILRDKERKYFVEEVKEARITGEKRYLLGIRLCNPLFKEEEHPFFRYPDSIILPERVASGKKKILLVYSADYDLQRDFRKLHRKTGQDLTITIVYPG